MPNSTTLLILSEQPSSHGLAEELTLDGYRVRSAGTLAELQARCAPGDVELLIVLATSQPAPCLQALRALRAGELRPTVDPAMRVLWAGAGGELDELLRAFDAGADDVLRSPWVYAELRARVQALLRREHQAGPRVRRYLALEVDTAALRASLGTVALPLKPQEFALLSHLARAPDRVHTRAELLREVWGYRASGSTRTLDCHACRLRRKLADAGAEGWISTVRGVGYRLAPLEHRTLRVVAPDALSA